MYSVFFSIKKFSATCLFVVYTGKYTLFLFPNSSFPNSSDITIEDNDTVETLINKINGSTDGKIKASYSEMTGKFTIETKSTGINSEFKIVKEDDI